MHQAIFPCSRYAPGTLLGMIPVGLCQSRCCVGSNCSEANGEANSPHSNAADHWPIGLVVRSDSFQFLGSAGIVGLWSERKGDWERKANQCSGKQRGNGQETGRRMAEILINSYTTSLLYIQPSSFLQLNTTFELLVNYPVYNNFLFLFFFFPYLKCAISRTGPHRHIVFLIGKVPLLWLLHLLWTVLERLDLASIGGEGYRLGSRVEPELLRQEEWIVVLQVQISSCFVWVIHLYGWRGTQDEW